MIDHIVPTSRLGSRIRPSFLLGMVTAMLLSLACAGQALTEEVRKTIQPSDIARLQSVVEAHISPDGNQVAYGLAFQRQPLKDHDGPAWVELHVVDAEGKSRPFVTGHVNVQEIQWTPDGRQIAYTAKRHDDEQTSLYVIPLDGGESTRLLEHPTGVSGVAFSADGQRIAFLATEEQAKEAKESREKGFDQVIYEEDAPLTKVWIARTDGSEPPRALHLPGSASFVQWHPQGRELVVTLAPTPTVDDSYMYRRVHVVDADSGAMVDHVANPGKLGQVGWSPDGKHLAMISGVDIHDPGEGRLMVAAIPGDGQLRDLMPTYEAHVSSFAWIDPQTLLWLADEGEYTTVGTVTTDGQSRILVPATGPILSQISASTDGTLAAALGHAPRHPSEVFRWRVADDAPKRLTDGNPWLSTMEFAEQEVVTWNARDGLELRGVLVRPLNHVEGRRYPLILVVHGGPESHVPNGWVTSYANPGQMGAARGFAVFYPNYRGSTGRGVEFSKMGQADAAGKEFDDLIDAVDHLVETGLVDKGRVGITGGSYGGYASAWGATYYSDRYAASVMFVGISDNISKVGTTDIPEEMYLVHHRKRLWDDWPYFQERSPIRHVQKNRTPTLILHGKEDPRVHPSQSLELHRHLKTLGQAPVRLVLYRGEGHGNRKAAARFDYNLRLLQWMEHYLQGPGGAPPPFAWDYAQELD